MALRNIFKKKKLKEEKKEELIKPVERPREETPPEKPLSTKPAKVKEKRIGEAYRILKAPQITEKATALSDSRQYVFKVWERANKIEIRKVIEDLYGVDVVSVKIINIPKKKRRLGRISGWRTGYKKAIVKVKEGQKIEVLPR